ncbi:MAG: hypothetical protein L3J11_09155, partial [Draconibacterium sp.]|nr:hypothetical protein [Draconibacterium sp.]
IRHIFFDLGKSKSWGNLSLAVSDCNGSRTFLSPGCCRSYSKVMPMAETPTPIKTTFYQNLSLAV